MRHFSLLLIGLITFVLVSSPLRAEEGRDAATTAAQAWLGTVDQGDYAGSWTAASSYFQGAVPKDKWAQMLGGVRSPLGGMKSRKLTSATFATSLPGAPDGKYWILQFTTTFARKAAAVETVTPMFENGAWKVSGYFIK